MPLETFKLPKPDVRLVVLDDTVYKIKLNLRKSAHTHSHRADQGLLCQDKKNQDDIEKTLSVVLGMGVLQPVETNNLIIYPYRKRWETAEKLLFSQHSKPLKAHPYAYSFYIEEKKPQQMIQVKKRVVGNIDKEPSGHPSGTSLDISTSSKRQKHDTNVDSQNATSTETVVATRTRQQTVQHETFKHPESVQRNRSTKTRATRKRRYSATEYEQKDRHDIEDRELQEHLRLQAMATPIDEEAAMQALDQEVSNSSSTLETVIRAFVSPVTAVKRLFGGSDV